MLLLILENIQLLSVKHLLLNLTAENHKQLYIPRGFAHGFVVLSDKAVFFYKCDNFYNKESELGIMYNDPDLKINWQLADERFNTFRKR